LVAIERRPDIDHYVASAITAANTRGHVMSFPLDEGLLEIFSNSFYGYGAYRSPIWFIGPQATMLGRDRDEAARRLELWHRRGQPQTVDLPRFYSMMGEKKWFTEAAQLHRVWSKLARIALAFQDGEATERVRSYQAEELGRMKGQNLLLHLLAAEHLPDAEWPYTRLETPYLRRPDLYVERFAERRALHISRQIRRYNPRVAVFYDLTNKLWWNRITGAEFEKSSVRDCFAVRRDSTLYLMVRHPESIGTRNDYFTNVGRLAASMTTDSHE
jgi:hypothetical protein